MAHPLQKRETKNMHQWKFTVRSGFLRPKIQNFQIMTNNISWKKLWVFEIQVGLKRKFPVYRNRNTALSSSVFECDTDPKDSTLNVSFDWGQKTVLELTEGAFLKPFTAWNIPPPIAPMVKAPPQSSTILQGLKAEHRHFSLFKLIMSWHLRSLIACS